MTDGAYTESPVPVTVALNVIKGFIIDGGGGGGGGYMELDLRPWMACGCNRYEQNTVEMSHVILHI